MKLKLIVILPLLLLSLMLISEILEVNALVVETRYFRNSQSTVNGLLAYDFLILNTITSDQVYIGGTLTSATIYVGIRVWKRTSLGVETEITSGISVAVASLGTGASGWYQISSTWIAVQTSLSLTDSIIVRVYGELSDNTPDVLLRTFQTEQIGATQLDVATWTVYYWIHRVRTFDDEGGYDYDWWYVHGGTTYNSRIINFTWSVSVTPQILNVTLNQVTETIQILNSNKKIYNVFNQILETKQNLETTIRHRLFIDLNQISETIQEFATKRIIKPIFEQLTETNQFLEFPITEDYTTIIAIIVVLSIMIFVVLYSVKGEWL